MKKASREPETGEISAVDFIEGSPRVSPCEMGSALTKAEPI